MRQLRLRDIGGIIVIDFIDMSNPKNRETVEEALRTELERDRTKTYVVEISPLGLVEMTRQNVTDGPREILTTKCAVCAGDGFVVSEATHALEIERKLRDAARRARACRAFSVGRPSAGPVAARRARRERLEAIEAAARRRFFLVPATSDERARPPRPLRGARSRASWRRCEPAAPFEEGATLELKLVEVGLYDATAGVGKVDGWEVVVAGAAKLVGKKVAVKVGRVLDGTAFATPADGTEPPHADHVRDRGGEADACGEREEDRGRALELEAAEEPEPETASPRPRSRNRETDARRRSDGTRPASAQRRGGRDADRCRGRRSGAEPLRARSRGPERLAARLRRRSGRAAARAAAAAARRPRRRRRPSRHQGATPRRTRTRRRRRVDRSSRRPEARAADPRSRTRSRGGRRSRGARSAGCRRRGASADGEAPKKRTRRGTRGGRKRRKPSANGPARR